MKRETSERDPRGLIEMEEGVEISGPEICIPPGTDSAVGICHLVSALGNSCQNL